MIDFQASRAAFCILNFSVTLILISVGPMAKAVESRVPVAFSGGHESDPRDHGRPVVLIAAALKVRPEVFRQAFSGVNPARGRRPTGDEQRRNKEALLKVLGPYNVTNERLDEVSDYYRYRPEKGELWPNKPAKAEAIVENGNIKKITITDTGAGYSSPPKATVKGFEKVPLETKLKFGTDFKKNGSVASIAVAAPNKAAASR
jgi:hypothetical protein